MNNNTGELIVTLESEDRRFPLDRFGLTYDSTDDEIINAISPALLEETGFNLKEEIDNQGFTLKRADNTKTVFIFPKSTAG